MKVRLKPHNPDAGNLMRSYTAPWGDTFNAGVWLEIADSNKGHLEYLRGVRQRNRDVSSLFAFDVCTESEARAIRRAEEAAAAGYVAVVRAEDQGPRAPLTKPGVQQDKELNQPTPTHELSMPAPTSQPVEEENVDLAEGVEPDPPGRRTYTRRTKTTEEGSDGSAPSPRKQGPGRGRRSSRT
jgi:hypothetical protein